MVERMIESYDPLLFWGMYKADLVEAGIDSGELERFLELHRNTIYDDNSPISQAEYNFYNKFGSNLYKLQNTNQLIHWNLHSGLNSFWLGIDQSTSDVIPSLTLQGFSRVRRDISSPNSDFFPELAIHGILDKELTTNVRWKRLLEATRMQIHGKGCDGQIIENDLETVARALIRRLAVLMAFQYPDKVDDFQKLSKQSEDALTWLRTLPNDKIQIRANIGQYSNSEYIMQVEPFGTDHIGFDFYDCSLSQASSHQAIIASNQQFSRQVFESFVWAAKSELDYENYSMRDFADPENSNFLPRQVRAAIIAFAKQP